MENILSIADDLSSLVLAIAVIMIAVFSILSFRKKIIFKAWVNCYNENDKLLSKRLAELLLFKIQYIKKIHFQTKRKLSLWNPYEEMPIFTQSLDEDIELLASVELGNYGKFVSNILTLIFKLIPMVVKPATLQGSIHKYGEKVHFLVNINNFTKKNFSKSKNLLWEHKGNKFNEDQFPDIIEELAYRIYLDLSGEDLFKSWESFMFYTKGLERYINYINLNKEEDRKQAEKYYNKASAIEPENAAVNYNVGVLKYYNYQLEDNREAQNKFRQAINSPNFKLSARARSGIANALSQKMHRFNEEKNIDTYKEAIDHARIALFLDKKSDAAHKAFAFSCHQLSEFLYSKSKDINDQEVIHYKTAAIYHYEKAYHFNPKHFISMNNLGNLYLEWSNTLGNNSIKFERYTENQKGFSRLKRIWNRSVTENRDSLLRKGLKACGLALEINPGYKHAYDNLGNIYLAQKKYEKAEEAFLSALQYDPDYAEAKNDLAILYMQSAETYEDVEKAIRTSIEAIALIEDENNITQKEKLKDQFVRQLNLAKNSTLNLDDKKIKNIESQIKSSYG